jgi:threonine/homoserine/homoserine lactone efflux protein
MVDPVGFLSLLTFVFAATASPGGATTLVAASGTRFGYLRSVPLMAGICFGMGSLTATLSFGLGALLETVEALEVGLKILGTVYLLYLAWIIGRQGAPRASNASETPIGFLQGFALVWVNPKVWTLGMAASSAYLGLTSEPGLDAVLIAAVFIAVGTVSASLWCWLGTKLGQMLSSEAQWRAVNIGFGALLALSILPIWL